MPAELDQKLALISRLLLLVLNPTTVDGEWSNAFTALLRILEEVDLGGHQLVARLTAPVVTKEDLQRVLETGRALGRAEEAAKRQRAVATVTSLATNYDGDGCDGYPWRAVVGFCFANRHRISDGWEVNFISNVASQLSNPYSTLSAKQAPIVRRIFQRWFGGVIT